MNRRDFILKTAGAGLIAALTPVVILAGDEQNEEAKKEEEKEPTLEELAQKWNMPLSEVQRIDKEMKQPVMETLKGYAQPVCHSTYNREVFQEHLPKEQRKPSLVMFYNENISSGPNYSRGLAPVFKDLSKTFVNKVKFLCYDGNCDEWSRQNGHENLVKVYDIIEPPSIAMYCPFDLLKKETPEKNDGKIKRIDTLKGGPVNTKWALDWINNIAEYWIPTNITNPNNQYVYKTQNTSGPKWTKITIQS